MIYNSKKIISKIKQIPAVVKTYIKARPLTSFFTVLGLLLIAVILSSILGQPTVNTTETVPETKTVATYRIGQAPRITVNAKIEKSGVITITAQTPGIVQTIPVEEGQILNAGQTIVGLASNYQGGNAASVQRQLASANYQFNKDNVDLNKEMIAKRREIAEKTDTNADELRRISNESQSKTQEVIDLSKQTIDLIDDQIETLEAMPTPDTSAISLLKAQKVGLLNGLNAAESALRNTDYSTSDNAPPAQLSNTAKDLTLKQLDLEAKSIELALEISLLNLRLAQISEAMMYPAAPFSGRVERIYVKVGQSVNPGQPLATISGSDQTITAVALVPQSVAQNLSKIEESILTLGGQSYGAMPIHIAQEATDGQLMAVVFSITKNSASLTTKGYQTNTALDAAIDHLVQGEYIDVSVPIGYADTNSIIPFVPLDAIYQTQDAAYLFILNPETKTVETRVVTLGKVYGSFVEVVTGLQANDAVILNRTVVSGESVKTL